ncbi:MAG: hypothetical protein CL908_17995 [Deltaproteobacteria bacterium]|nr:hypothetical protein [Deltaproteobacteria bacterium]
MLPGLGTTTTNGAPLRTLRGTEDASNDLLACAEREAELRALGGPISSSSRELSVGCWSK